MADATDPPAQSAANTENETTTDNMTPQDRLAHLTAQATAEYAVKHYNEAAELYSQASEIQADLNGDMAVENADLLYAYGKCLFFLAQQTSSVLGGTAASAQLNAKKEKKPSKKRKVKSTQPNGEAGSSRVGPATSNTTSDTIPKVADAIPESDITPNTTTDSSKPFFQIEGDAAEWTSDEDDNEENQDPQEEEDDEDDFANSYELLDLARILYLRKLEEATASSAEASTTTYIPSISLTPAVRETKSRIADIHDLQSEVLLESEKYALAADDLSKCLALREELDPPESSLLAECHYKLSLALEFASQSQQRDDDGNPVGDIVVDWTIRDTAITHQEKAIESCKLRVKKETATLESLPPGKEKDKLLAEIEDVQDMLVEMETRLSDLRKPPVNVKEETDMKEQIAGVLGTLMGARKEDKEETLAKVVGGATDIGGLVKRKKKVDGGSAVDSGASTPAPEGANRSVNGKRKVQFVDDAESTEGKGKKAKVEDVEDSGA